MKQNLGASFIEFVAGGLSLSRVPGRQDDAGAAGREQAANSRPIPLLPPVTTAIGDSGIRILLFVMFFCVFV